MLHLWIPLTSVTNEMNRLKGQVDAYIILSHLGIDSTTKQEWRGDYLTNMLSQNKVFMNNAIIVLDGHSHSVIDNGVITNNTLLAQTGTALSNIGKITFDLNNKDYKATMIKEADTTNVTQDADVKAIVDNAKTKFGEATSEVVFFNKEPLQGERAYVRTQETNLGNAIADAMEAYAENGFESAGDFAVTNGGGIRASIDSNKDVTVGDIIKVLPFGNTITQIKVKGSDVQAMFEHALSAPTVETDGKLTLDANGAFLHISKSIRVHYDITKPVGERVYAIEVLNKQTGEFEALDMNRTYNVVTNDFLAVGGDGFTMLGGPREEGPSLDAVVRQYFKTADMTMYDTDVLSRILATMGIPEAPIVEDTNEEPTTEIPTTEAPTVEDTQSVSTNVDEYNEATTETIDVHKNIPVKQTSVVNFKGVKAKADTAHTTKHSAEKAEKTHQTLPITGEAAGGGVIALSLLTAGIYLVRRKSA
ncbi:5'-nucleotidase C-terminal domain-containing protein [Macrococcus armenti]|uniref:5'-nucleotidase C-terminal domain-containing protein n=2 Tax=Macrococcus armenti TaxID=2875764 RepID=UPI001CCF4B00|nr:5'-nucleotidase C-terminal domain-containing protein [Macrococcus armenti]UBH17147.1 5'-nucleotidase C-terminal domain-containing protein [Macrococcus armenti]